MRVALLLLVGCGRVDFGEPLDAADATAGAPIDFVRAQATQCTLPTTMCSANLTGTGQAGTLLLITTTYSSGAVQVTAVRDNAPISGTYSLVLGPIDWPAPSTSRTELWAGTAGAVGALAVTVTYAQTATGLAEVWAGEYTARGIDQTAYATAASGTGASSGPRMTAHEGELIWGHGLCSGTSQVGAGAGFTPRLQKYGDLLEDAPAPTADAYQAGFSVNPSNAWVALMVTLE